MVMNNFIKKFIYKENMEAVDVEVKKRGGSLVVVLPPRYVKELDLQDGDYLRLRARRMKLVPVVESEEEENAKASPSSTRSPQGRKTPRNLTMNIQRVRGTVRA